MASCPNCGRKLHLTDWRPICPECGVNLNYFNANEKLIEESEKAEIEHARFQPKVDRGKAATIGTKTGIVRMVLFLIPVLSLLLPIFSITVSGNYKSYNAIDIYNAFSAVDTGKILSSISPLILAVAFVAVPAVCCVVFTLLQITAGKPKGLTRNIVLSCVSLALVGASLGSMFAFAQNPADDYAGIVMNEAQVALGKGQGDVDAAAQKILNIFNDSAVDTSRLEKAVAYGEAAFASADGCRYTAEQLTELKAALKDGRELLDAGEYTADSVREASAAIIGATAVYADLKTAVKYAALIENDGSFSESSFASLTAAIDTGKETLDLLAKGEPIVELTKQNGALDKTAEEIEADTAARIEEVRNNINNAIASLTDVSVLNAQIAKLDAAINGGSIASADIKASAGIGEFVFVILLLVQLANNIRIKKKGFEVKYTQCLIGGLPSEEYFGYIEQGMPLYEIREKMVAVLTVMQNEVRAQAAEAAAKEQAERATHK